MRLRGAERGTALLQFRPGAGLPRLLPASPLSGSACACTHLGSVRSSARSVSLRLK